jgi:hypothetical protein
LLLVTVWLIREEDEKRRKCPQSQKGYQSVTFPGRQDALAACIGWLYFPGAIALQRIRHFVACLLP